MLKHALLRRVAGPRGAYYADSRIDEPVAVADFGLQWREFDPYPELQALSHSHLFGRFLLPQNYFRGKVVVDLGCGNGRLGQFVIRDARTYIGVELSDAITAFEVPAEHAGKVELVRASIEDVPLQDRIADVVICWGALHHVGNYRAAIGEIRRILKPGASALLFVYPDNYAPRENLNRLLKHIDAAEFRDFCRWFFSTVRRWGTVDEPLAADICAWMGSARKSHTGWEVFQMFDGLGPEHHHLLEQTVIAEFSPPWHLAATQSGCFVIEAPA